MRIGRRGRTAVNTEQLDLYLTTLLSVVVGALGMFNLVDQSVLAGATLATLGVMSMGALSVRRQIAALTTTATDLVAMARVSVTWCGEDTGGC